MINLYKIKEKFNESRDLIVYKEQIKYLQKKVKELEEERKPLIDLKNKYLTDFRCKNLEIGRLKKKVMKWIICKQQYSIEPFISTDELDELLDILKEVSE